MDIATGQPPTNAFNPDFQEQLIQEYLLDRGIITPEQLSRALTRLRELRIKAQREQQAAAYVFDQKTYTLHKRDPWSGKSLAQLSLPFTRKTRPRYFGTDWVPTGSGSVFLFHATNAREIGEIFWENPEESQGLTISDRYAHLYFGEVDEHPYLALSDRIHYSYIPMGKVPALPVDLIMAANRQTAYLADRARGTIFLVDTQEMKALGSFVVRPPGSKKILGLAPTPDGQRIFVTDYMSPSLLILTPRNLKIKRVPLPYGILGNVQLSPDGQWLYLQSMKSDDTVEIVVLDTINLLHKATIPLRGHLFSALDDPLDLMAISPLHNYLIFMTYVNNPAMFTPWINIVDLDSYQLIDRYALLSDESKPSHINFAITKPDDYFRSDSTILEVLLDMGYVSVQDVEDAEWTIQETLGRGATQTDMQLQLDLDEDFESYGDVPDFDESIFELPPEEESQIEAVERRRGNPEEDYPVLHQYQIDPSILIQFKESLLRQYEFVPINALNGILRVAAVNPNRPEIEMIARKLFPDQPLFSLPFEKAEFDRFMIDFYSLIMTRMKNIVTRMTPEQRDEFMETAPEGVMENLHAFTPPPEMAQLPVPEIPAPPPVAPSQTLPTVVEPAPRLPEPVEEAYEMVVTPPAEEDLAPRPLNESAPAETPADGPLDFSKLPAEQVNEALTKYCLNEFKKIWGIDVSNEVSVRETLTTVIERARKELINFDYTIIRVPDLFNQFSLETVITREIFTQLVQHLAPSKTTPKPKPQGHLQDMTHRMQAAAAGVNRLQPAASGTSRMQTEGAEDVIRVDDLPDDHFLVQDIERQRVIEFSNKGMISWQAGGFDGIGSVKLDEPYNPLRLPNGNTIIADAGQDAIFEVSKSGQVRWQFPPTDKSSDIRLHRPVKALRKLNGNTIIVDQGNHRIIEINTQGKIVWQYGITSSVGIARGRLYSPSDVQPLKGGHFLITDTDNHRVIEVTPDEEIIWQYGNDDNKLGSGYGSGFNQLNAPTQAFRLPNGHTLISDSENRRVIEVNPEREIVWHFDTGIEKASGGAFSFVPNRVIRMGNGNTVVFSPQYVIEVTRLLRPLYLFQYAHMPKAPDYEGQRQESEKIVPLSTKPSANHINELARQAAQTYVTTKANLTDLELPLVDKQENRVYIVNRQKVVTWRFGEGNPRNPQYLERPQHAELSPREDSHVLITDTDRHRVIKIYRPTKEILWQYGETGVMGSRPGQLGHPRSAVTTPDNTILITDQYSGRVLEVSEFKQIIWSFGGWDTGVNPLNAPYYAEKTPDDTVLITDWSNHYVIEVNREGEIVWQYGTLKNPGSGAHQLMYPEKATRLINGNTLIVDTRNHRVIEVDPEGHITWSFGGMDADKSYKKVSNPTNAWRLDNGHTVIVHSSNRQILEVSMHRQVVWNYLLSGKR
jgi:DNA-binding beta-propeller fold protein YncE